jgi:hypothetical protein
MVFGSIKYCFCHDCNSRLSQDSNTHRFADVAKERAARHHLQFVDCQLASVIQNNAGLPPKEAKKPQRNIELCDNKAPCAFAPVVRPFCSRSEHTAKSAY